MRRKQLLAILAIALAGCGTSSATPTATPRIVAVPSPHPTSTRVSPKPTRTPIVIGKAYAVFTTALCRALAARDAGTVVGLLPYYQYNSGVRYGYLGDGEGQTADPSVLHTWLASAPVRCVYYTPDISGHGITLTSGWKVAGGPWALIEADIFQGHWKINDFTFGSQSKLYSAMHTVRPVLRYHG